MKIGQTILWRRGTKIPVEKLTVVDIERGEKTLRDDSGNFIMMYDDDPWDIVEV